MVALPLTLSPIRLPEASMRAREKSHQKAVRQLASRWVGILHACLERGCLYEEEIAWPTSKDIAA
jgi:hypothetical protein